MGDSTTPVRNTAADVYDFHSSDSEEHANTTSTTTGVDRGEVMIDRSFMIKEGVPLCGRAQNREEDRTASRKCVRVIRNSCKVAEN